MVPVIGHYTNKSATLILTHSHTYIISDSEIQPLCMTNNIYYEYICGIGMNNYVYIRVIFSQQFTYINLVTFTLSLVQGGLSTGQLN